MQAELENDFAPATKTATLPRYRISRLKYEDIERCVASRHDFVHCTTQRYHASVTLQRSLRVEPQDCMTSAFTTTKLFYYPSDTVPAL